MMSIFRLTSLTCALLYPLSKTHSTGQVGWGVCNRSFSSGTGLENVFGWVWEKIFIPEDPCDSQGGENRGFQGAGEGWEEPRGFWSLNLHF